MRRRILPLIEALVVSMMAAVGAVGCLASAFSLAISNEQPLLAAWVIWAILCAAFSCVRWGSAVLALLAAAGAAWLWHDGSFGTQLLSLLGTIAETYDGGYGFGVPDVLQVPQSAADLPLLVLGMAVIFAVSRTVCRGRSSTLPNLLLLVSLASTLVVTDTVPSENYLFLLLLSVCLLHLTDNLRREDALQAARLCGAALLPLALALGVLFYCFPQTQYVNTTQTLRENVLQFASELPETLRGTGSLLSSLRSHESVDLSSLPTQLQLGVPVAEVTASQSGSVYLRVRDYDVYTGKAWESSDNRQDTLVGSGEELGTVQISILNRTDEALIPAFPDGQVFLTDGAAESQKGSSTYLLREFSMAANPSEQWLTLPEDTSVRARALIAQYAISTDSVSNTVQNIAAFVRGSAVYDRSGTVMADGESDFALWFLQQADSGYCVHFATAAAVLLRSAGIPARYVTGYRVEAEAGQTVQVTSNDAHTWVEYYDYRTWGWYVLEATPASESESTEDSTQPSETVEPSPTAPQQTEEAQQPAASPAEPGKSNAGGNGRSVLRAVAIICCCMALLAAAELQRLIRIAFRRKAQSRGDNNHRAAACAREIALLSRLTGKEIPDGITELTQKALFSQHTLSGKELRAFAQCIAAYRRMLRKGPWWKKPLYRYVYAEI